MIQQARGPTDAETLNCLNSLALLRAEQSDYPAARRLCERALASIEQIPVPHPAPAPSLTTPAELRQAAGDTAAARPLLERALAIAWQTLSPPDPATQMIRQRLLDL